MAFSWNQIPEKTDNDKLELLFIAIHFNDLERVKAFKNDYPDLYAKRGEFKIDERVPFNLSCLTFFNKVIWFNSNWREGSMPFVNKHRFETEQMSAFWREESVCKKFCKNFKYNDYWEYFFCDDPNDYEEITFEPISSYLKKGFREIDLRLYNRAQCFDFKEVSRLLDQGAQPDVHFEHDGHSSTMARISDEYAYLNTCHFLPSVEYFKKVGYNQKFDIEDLFRTILGLTAHLEMYELLTSFNSGCNSIS